MVGGFLWVLRLPPHLKLAADIIRCIKNDNDLLNMFSEETTDHVQATGKLYHLRLRVECTLFVIYKTGREPTPYW
jgi:hypothetical protein